jgi:FkbM family methyltransferase
MKALIYKTIIRIYRIIPGKQLICKLLKIARIPNSKFYQDLSFNGPFKVEIPNKEPFKLWHHGGTIENETFWKGLFTTWESDTGWIWQELCLFSNTIFDVGANTGVYSMTAKIINPESKVFAFEPSNHTYKKLLLNNDLNEFDITCEQIALSNYNGKQVFYDTPDSNQTSASLSPDKLKNWEGYSGEIFEYEVETITLGDYIKNNFIENIDLIKMDIEMHEPEAIAGLGTYLQEYKPIVIIEVLSDKVADKLNELINNKEHVIFHLKGSQNAQLVENFSWSYPCWNYIFFHKDLTEKIKLHTTLYKKH